MSTITVRRSDVTSDEVADALRWGLGLRYKVLPGMGVNWNPFGAPRPDHPDTIVVGKGSTRLFRAQLRISHDAGKTILHISPGGRASNPVCASVVRADVRIWRDPSQEIHDAYRRVGGDRRSWHGFQASTAERTGGELPVVFGRCTYEELLPHGTSCGAQHDRRLPMCRENGEEDRMSKTTQPAFTSTHPPVVERATWQAEIDALRMREKAYTHEGDAIAAARRRLPMVEVDGAATLVGPDGPVALLDVFEGRQQLIAYFHMWYPGKPAAEQCEGCTLYNGHVRELAYLHSRDVTYATFCQGPYEESVRYRDFMGWEMPWYSVDGRGRVIARRPDLQPLLLDLLSAPG